jgi:hypothetical protein
MPPHKGLEGGFVALFDEAADEFPIGRPGLVLLQDNSKKMLDGISRHGSPSTRLSSAFRMLSAAGWRFDTREKGTRLEWHEVSAKPLCFFGLSFRAWIKNDLLSE